MNELHKHLSENALHIALIYGHLGSGFGVISYNEFPCMLCSGGLCILKQHGPPVLGVQENRHTFELKIFTFHR